MTKKILRNFWAKIYEKKRKKKKTIINWKGEGQQKKILRNFWAKIYKKKKRKKKNDNQLEGGRAICRGSWPTNAEHPVFLSRLLI